MRRRLLINNGNGISEGIAYSGTLEVAERTYDDVFFEAPGATHFAIRMNESPDLDTGQAFFATVVGDEQIVCAAYSGQTGISLSMGSQYTNTYNPSSPYPYLIFSNDGVTMKTGTIGTESYRRWFQAGKSYDWIAW